MQNEVIKISEERLGYPLPNEVINKIRDNRWGYMGLEMMKDTVTWIDVGKIENYLSSLY